MFLLLNELPQYVRFCMLWVIFGVCYYLGLNGIDDYTDITKAWYFAPYLACRELLFKNRTFF